MTPTICLFRFIFILSSFQSIANKGILPFTAGIVKGAGKNQQSSLVSQHIVSIRSRLEACYQNLPQKEVGPLLALPLCLIQDETCYRPSRLIPFLLLRNLIINGLFYVTGFTGSGGFSFLFLSFLLLASPERERWRAGGKDKRPTIKTSQSLAQTWHAMDSFHCFRLDTRKAIASCTNYVAPGQACLSCLTY